MDEKDYAARVRNLKASRFLYRADVIARVESEDDIAFWQKAIHHVRPSVKVKFIPAEVSDSNFKQRGKTLCMKLVEYLDQHFIICVDSDFDKFCILVYWNLPNIYCKLMFILGKTIIVKRIICSNSGIF